MTLPFVAPLQPSSGSSTAQGPDQVHSSSEGEQTPLPLHAASGALSELLATAPRRHALRLNPPTPLRQAPSTAALPARYAHD